MACGVNASSSGADAPRAIAPGIPNSPQAGQTAPRKPGNCDARLGVRNDRPRSAARGHDAQPRYRFPRTTELRGQTAGDGLLVPATGAVPSVSARGACDDITVAEAFFAPLEHELLADVTFVSRAAARPATFDFIIWYNGERRHSRLDYVSPVVYEQRLIAHPA